MRVFYRCCVGVAVTFLVHALAGHGAVAVWSNASGDCLWTNPANWVANLLPAPGDDVLIPAGAHVTNIYLSGANSPVIGTLTFSNSAVLNWYVSDGGYVTVGAIIKTNNTVNIRESNGGFFIAGDVLCEVGGPATVLSFEGANQLAGTGRVWKTGTRTLNVNTPGGHASFAGGFVLSNGNMFVQSPNGLGQGPLRAQLAGVYPNVLLQFLSGNHVISNDVQLDYRSANVGINLRSPGDVNTLQHKITFLGRFSRTPTTFGGQYLGLTADRVGYLEFATNEYAGDWLGMTNIAIRVSRGVHIFGATTAFPPASATLEINQVNILRAIEPTPTTVIFSQPGTAACAISVQSPLSNVTPASVIAANTPDAMVELAGTIALDDRTNLAVVFEAQTSNTTLVISGTITNTLPHRVILRGPGTLVVASSQGNEYGAGTLVTNQATVLAMNAQNSCFGTGDVVVAPGCTIGGTGVFASSVSLASGTHLAPGASVGTLHVGGNFAAGPGLVYHWEKGVSAADRVAIGGSLANLSGMTVIVSRVGVASPGFYVETNALFTYAGSDPVLTDTVILYDSSSDWTGGEIGVGNGQVYITGILPEPSLIALMAVAVGGWARWRT